MVVARDTRPSVPAGPQLGQEGQGGVSLQQFPPEMVKRRSRFQMSPGRGKVANAGRESARKPSPQKAGLAH